MIDTEDLENRFSYHHPNPMRIAAHSEIRKQALLMANIINEQVPKGREQSVAITKLEEVMFWANAGLARQK